MIATSQRIVASSITHVVATTPHSSTHVSGFYNSTQPASLSLLTPTPRGRHASGLVAHRIKRLVCGSGLLCLVLK
jgi:hypothetical protein